MRLKLLPALIGAAVAINGAWGLDSITHLQRRNVRPKQPSHKETQSEAAKKEALAKAEAKRARKQAKKDNR